VSCSGSRSWHSCWPASECTASWRTPWNAAGAGIVLSLAFTRLLESLLFQVRPSDPGTFVAVLAVIGLAAWAASYISALRGTRIDPMETMRAE
jgi:ABC-type lipoprotein release transport system permease subunit